MTINEDFIVISDFHGIYEAFFKLKDNYILKYDNIYILGDATDRGYDGNGGGGVKLLLKIMDLEKKIKSLPQDVRDRNHIGCIHYSKVSYLIKFYITIVLIIYFLISCFIFFVF